MTVPDKLAVGNHVFTDHDPHPPLSWSITDIFAQSSNVGTILTAQKLGKERLDHYMRAFGYGKRTGVGFPGEATGLVINPKDYWITTMGSVPIGSPVAVTALQMLQVYATVGNGGVWQAPKLVAATIDADGKRRATKPGESRRVISAETAGKVNRMLRTVVSDGTGSKAAIPGYTVGGKTGTARKPRVGGLGYEGYVASFAGFVPAEDPRLAAVVVIDEPKGYMIYGGQVAAPVFSRVAVRPAGHADPPAHHRGGPAAAHPGRRPAAAGDSARTRIPASGPRPVKIPGVLLDEVRDAVTAVEVRGDLDVEVTSVDPRQPQGDVPARCSAASPGTSDGHDLAGRLAAGRSARRGTVPRRADAGVDVAAVPQIRVPSVRAVMGPLAAAVLGRPSESLRVLGVTGTNGKTT